MIQVYKTMRKKTGEWLRNDFLLGWMKSPLPSLIPHECKVTDEKIIEDCQGYFKDDDLVEMTSVLVVPIEELPGVSELATAAGYVKGVARREGMQENSFLDEVSDYLRNLYETLEAK